MTESIRSPEHQITQKYLHECFDYDPDTGVLIWRVRPLGYFKNSSSMATSNTRFAGKPVGTEATPIKYLQTK